MRQRNTAGQDRRSPRRGQGLCAAGAGRGLGHGGAGPPWWTANDFKIADWLRWGKGSRANSPGVLDSRRRLLYVLDRSSLCRFQVRFDNLKISEFSKNG